MKTCRSVVQNTTAALLEGSSREQVPKKLRLASNWSCKRSHVCWQVGKEPFQWSNQVWLEVEHITTIHDRLLKMKLIGFSNINKKSQNQWQAKVSFCMQTVIFCMDDSDSHSRTLELKKNVLAQPLRPMPWALSTLGGSWRKTSNLHSHLLYLAMFLMHKQFPPHQHSLLMKFDRNWYYTSPQPWP